METQAAADRYLDDGEGEKALSIYEYYAERGSLSAIHAIGHTCLYGIAGVKQDYDTAVRWFSRGAEGGCPQCMYHMGMCNAKGYGTPADPERAAEWYRKSADRGDEDAMYELGICYEKGFGVEADPAQADDWYRKAARLGQEEAAKKLADR